MIKKTIFFSLTAIVFNTIAYYGFITNYTGNVFSESSFHKQYDKKVYKYRLLSKYLLLEVYDVLKKKHPEKETLQNNNPLKKLDPNASENLYRAYYLLNTTFLILCAIILVLLFENKILKCEEKEKWLIIFLLLAMISITQFVIVPYDVTSYFLILTSVFSLLLYFQKKSMFWLIITGSLICIATLNRETSALIVSLAATLYLIKSRVNRSFFFVVGFLMISFLVPYICLRLCLGTEPAFSNSLVFLKSNLLDFNNRIGLLFWLILGTLSIVITQVSVQRKAILIFHLFSIPYIFMCVFSGILFEMRLYIPLFIISMVIAKIDPLLLSNRPIEKNEIL